MTSEGLASWKINPEFDYDSLSESIYVLQVYKRFNYALNKKDKIL